MTGIGARRVPARLVTSPGIGSGDLLGIFVLAAAKNKCEKRHRAEKTDTCGGEHNIGVHGTWTIREKRMWSKIRGHIPRTGARDNGEGDRQSCATELSMNCSVCDEEGDYRNDGNSEMQKEVWGVAHTGSECGTLPNSEISHNRVSRAKTPNLGRSRYCAFCGASFRSSSWVENSHGLEFHSRTIAAWRAPKSS
jgi:hypothetical protein